MNKLWIDRNNRQQPQVARGGLEKHQNYEVESCSSCWVQFVIWMNSRIRYTQLTLCELAYAQFDKCGLFLCELSPGWAFQIRISLALAFSEGHCRRGCWTGVIFFCLWKKANDVFALSYIVPKVVKKTNKNVNAWKWPKHN